MIREKRYDVTDDLKNWDDFELSHKRPNYDGVVRSYSTSFEFVNNAFILLKKEYRSRYMEASASVIFSLRNNNWEYDEVFRCALDFSTYSEDGYVVSINAIDNTLSAIIKAKKSIQYEYPVVDLYTRNLKYDGLKFQYEAKYVSGGSSVEDDDELQYIQYHGQIVDGGPAAISFPLYKLDNSELPKLDSPLVFTDEPFSSDGSVRTFAEALSDIDIIINLSFSFYIVDDTNKGTTYAQIVLFVKRANGTLEQKMRTQNTEGNTPTVVDESINISLHTGDMIGMDLLLYNTATPITMTWTTYLRNFSMAVNFKSQIKPVNIDVVSPIELLNKLLASMSETTDTYYGIIDDYDPRMSLDRLSTVYIMAAESARGLPKAKLYTSYKKYCDWMEAEFGYVPVISGNEVTFIHRDKLFTDTVVKELGKKINDYELSVNDGLIYSSVKVGYDKQDYDSINGRDEFRFTNEFSTGLKLLDNTLSLISPYRADAYGIEFLVQKRGEDTTDSNSDNDVFFVSCDQDGVNLKLYRPYSTAQLSGLLSPETMFNIQYSPRFMLEANKKYIGACIRLLKFASSDGNSDVSIDGVRETDDLLIPERLFTVGEVSIKTSDIDVPSDLTGLVRFTNQSETITGYIKNLSLNIAKEKGSTYTLIVRDIKS
ncbi:hypothetical protein [Bacteroides finegoldii]|uniref:hypothetical protein n=1 Tax=Bacteroides finegoldii TaxID=338188 RepID=UPI0022E1307F|nr:hypothetical protein [Bacteroides finegoldii]